VNASQELHYLHFSAIPPPLFKQNSPVMAIHCLSDGVWQVCNFTLGIFEHEDVHEFARMSSFSDSGMRKIMNCAGSGFCFASNLMTL